MPALTAPSTSAPEEDTVVAASPGDPLLSLSYSREPTLSSTLLQSQMWTGQHQGLANEEHFRCPRNTINHMYSIWHSGRACCLAADLWAVELRTSVLTPLSLVFIIYKIGISTLQYTQCTKITALGLTHYVCQVVVLVMRIMYLCLNR